MNYAEKFLQDRKKLRKNYSEWREIDIHDNILTFNSPDLLAAFAGYLKYQLKDAKVYFRGEKNYYKTTIPSLYRFKNSVDFTNENIKKRTKAYSELITRLPSISLAKRFKQKDFSSLLQHYGIGTNWIDLVDNIFIALWFSNWNANNQIGYTYVKFFASQLNNDNLKIIDLRENYTSLSLRPHCQHGISATKKVDIWNVENSDFSTNLIAIAKIPNISDFKLNGQIFNGKYMFPDEIADNTLKLLKKNELTKLLAEICDKHGLNRNELGNIE
jgi:hypothetical protein